MNRGVLQLQSSSMMPAGNPNWPWNTNGGGTRSPHPLSPFFATSAPNSSFLFSQCYAPTSSPLPFSNSPWSDLNQEFPESLSLSQLMIMGGLVGEEAEKGGIMNSSFQGNKVIRLENWEEQVLVQNSPNASSSIVDVKQEDSGSSFAYGHHHANNNSSNSSEHYQSGNSAKSTNNWTSPPPMVSASSPKSSVTSLSNGVLDFASKKTDGRHPPPDRSSEGNSNATGGGAKKAKVQPSSAQSTFKVRKEKLGDRISALHQLVSPFGKTDTASVLLEAIGYIRFLQNQIEALSLPYLGNASGNMRHPTQPVRGERNCIFPEDPGQLLNGNCMKRKGTFEQDSEDEPRKDLRSRGLCLVPVSCTLQVGSDNGADYWASAFGGGFR